MIARKPGRPSICLEYTRGLVQGGTVRLEDRLEGAVDDRL
jgi:hypothetical protein